MWIEHANYGGKQVTWATTGGIEGILLEAIRYAENNRWMVSAVSTSMGNTYDEKQVTVDFE